MVAYKAKNLVSVKYLLAVKKEIEVTEKATQKKKKHSPKKKTMSKGAVKRKLMVDLSESNSFDVEQERLLLTQLFILLFFRIKRRTNKINLV